MNFTQHYLHFSKFNYNDPVKVDGISIPEQGIIMNTPEWTKPAAVGAVAGAIALAIVGFSWGGWMTATTAAAIANDQSRDDVVAVLMPICVDQAGKDPEMTARIAELKDAPSYQRGDIVTKAGWATMPGSTDVNRRVAQACAERLIG